MLHAKTEQRPAHSGVAGPLAARGSGHICCPSVSGFGNWRAV